jgi:rubrerythrin
MDAGMSDRALPILGASREREKEQTRFYRALAALAESAGDEALSERFNALLADEQHHLSRLTARILELGGSAGDPEGSLELPTTLEGWEEVARAREEVEVEWYRGLISEEVDPTSGRIFREILESEEQHARELAGKWISA